MKRLYLFVVIVLSSICVLSGQNVDECAPAYFGPNAQPVPPVNSARVSEKMNVTVAGDYYAGFAGDRTYDVFYFFDFPFASRRMSLNVWGALSEWYQTPTLKGQEWGDVYISTDIQMCRDKDHLPDILVRAGIKTASGGSYDKKRYFDSPGYFFDALIGESLHFKGCYFSELRAIINMGFLCWQLDNALQNDAFMYGASFKAVGKRVDLEAHCGGYAGWRRNGDNPNFVSFRATLKLSKFDLFADYGHGLKDYPFNRYRVGITVPIAKLNKN